VQGNSFALPAPVSGNAYGQKLESSKTDKRLHGFGLKSVAKILRKYNGDYAWDYNALNSEFIVTAMLSLSKN